METNRCEWDAVAYDLPRKVLLPIGVIPCEVPVGASQGRFCDKHRLMVRDGKLDGESEEADPEGR